MTMRNYLIFVVSLIFSVTGFLVPTEWLAMMAGENGDLLIPVSSGSEDPLIIKLALVSYIVSFMFSGICLYLNSGVQFIFRVYMANSAFYIFFMFLLSLDSSVFVAAKYRNLVPVSLIALWLVANIPLIWASFNKNSLCDAKDARQL